MKALLDLFKQASQEEDFDAIRISLASPEKILSWSYGEVRSRRQLTIERLSLNVTVCFVRKFLGR